MVVKQKEGKFFRSSTGSKKIAPVNMRREEHQFVIDGFSVDEVLNQIPQNLKIIQACVYLIKRESDNRITVPNVLKKYGVSMMRQGGERKSCHIVFDAASRTVIKSSVSKVCEKVGIPYHKAYFKYIVLSNGTSSCRFDHCTKEQRPYEADQRKKLRVLGATSGQGKVQGLIADLGAKKFNCSMREEVVKMVMCTRD